MMSVRISLVCLLLALPLRPAAAQDLVADLSSHLIAITSSYAGAELLLFGAREEGGDVIVVVRGPPQRVMVRQKRRIGGIWINRDSAAFVEVPGYYAVHANRILADIASASVLARQQIGVENLILEAEDIDTLEAMPFREALIRDHQKQGLFREESGKVAFLGNRLFRTKVRFPAKTPVGSYTAEIYVVRDGHIVSALITPLFVRKTGVERAVFDFAHRQPATYGLAAVLIALAAGWLAGAVFRKV